MFPESSCPVRSPILASDLPARRAQVQKGRAEVVEAERLDVGGVLLEQQSPGHANGLQVVA
jgi:hypothetical protein